MLKYQRWFSRLAILTALVLVVAACGSDTDLGTGDTRGVEETEGTV
jgi:hypothetical protein